jgi:putative hydrolase of the HAD superfamily
MIDDIELIAFDADDTLWHNESIFQATEAQFVAMLSKYHPADWVRQRLFETETKNLKLFGYGIKGFILSMIESAIELTEGRIVGAEVQTIIRWGQEMLEAPIALLDGVRDTIDALAPRYRLMLRPRAISSIRSRSWRAPVSGRCSRPSRSSRKRTRPPTARS